MQYYLHSTETVLHVTSGLLAVGTWWCTNCPHSGDRVRGVPLFDSQASVSKMEWVCNG